MPENSEISALIAGSGGQGVLFMGKLLAHAAMLAGKNVTWFPSYGAEVRGGTANCTVVISDDIIGSPVVRNPDILIAMNEASSLKFERRLRPGGLMILDESLVKKRPARKDVKIMGIPATEIAASLGNTRSANMVMLGALLAAGIIDEGSALSALEESAASSKKTSLKLNKEAIRKGKCYGGDKKG